jgi:chromosome segregation ATPase
VGSKLEEAEGKVKQLEGEAAGLRQSLKLASGRAAAADSASSELKVAHERLAAMEKEVEANETAAAREMATLKVRLPPAPWSWCQLGSPSGV